MLLIILVIAAVITFVEVPALAKKKRQKDILVFFSFLLIGVTLGIVFVFNLPYPNPIKLIEAIFKPIADLLMGKD